MSTVSSAPTGTSQFALTLIDLLDRVQYRRVTPSEQLDPVYRLRYEAYRREEFIPVNSQRITRDAYDDAANCYCFGVYIDDRLVSSIRLHIATQGDPTSPSRAIWPDVLGDILDKGGSYIDPSRFTADHEASLAFPALPYLTLRMAVMACEHFKATYCISSVRPEHAPFYKRVFGSTQLAGEGYWGELTFPVCLYASYIPVMYPRVISRYPFFDSTPEERAILFGPAAQAIAAITPTARQAQRLRQLETQD
ncbi:acyl-homoserine-lactone synthase [Devosia sp. FKR38]|uniref:N-acyl amino acid synthase FeeM domain-containing protein n=1 Tax=Devosia sp. FKR38 TaxID=2562312 RepID=UPI0010C11FFF|nr:acyl-homoserine-lactone synthase [Devosia sp. FKR38]